ncbi:MAG: helix-turn-helix transcriptional regulator, partial [Oscillospiraceae bacterium]
MENANHIVIKPALRELFETSWAQFRILLFSAPSGFGKTTAASALLAHRAVCTYSALERDFTATPIDPACDTVLIDDLQQVQSSDAQQTICDWIRTNPDKHFVLLSRG